jgi:hypothetical protein
MAPYLLESTTVSEALSGVAGRFQLNNEVVVRGNYFWREQKILNSSEYRGHNPQEKFS